MRRRSFRVGPRHRREVDVFTEASRSTQIARSLINQLVLKYTQAAMLNTFEIRYSTIKRDSALLDGYARERATIEALDDA